MIRFMRRHRRDFDVVLVWFGDAHASVATRAARLLRKPSAIVVGGYDVSDLPTYGYLSTELGRRRARAHFARATRILAVSTALQDQLVRRFPKVATKTVVLPTGVDTDRFRPNGPREPSVISVAGASEWMRAWVKGWDRIAAAARLLPEVSFRLIGAAPDVPSRLDAPENVTVSGLVSQEELVPIYQRATVYVQASRTEGLPNTVMEAMSSGCVPVVTRVGGMPELVDTTGFVTSESPQEIAAAIQHALKSPALGMAARQRVIERFSSARRESGLVALLEGLVESPS
jgi:glycosyltransferase involved in cell wall biosynthesis